MHQVFGLVLLSTDEARLTFPLSVHEELDRQESVRALGVTSLAQAQIKGLK